jgi:hypothetical protein
MPIAPSKSTPSRKLQMSVRRRRPASGMFSRLVTRVEGIRIVFQEPSPAIHTASRGDVCRLRASESTRPLRVRQGKTKDSTKLCPCGDHADLKTIRKCRGIVIGSRINPRLTRTLELRTHLRATASLTESSKVYSGTKRQLPIPCSWAAMRFICTSQRRRSHH